MSRTPLPVVAKRDGTVVHRAAGHVVGRVFLHSGHQSGGWVAETLTERLDPMPRKRDALRAIAKRLPEETR